MQRTFDKQGAIVVRARVRGAGRMRGTQGGPRIPDGAAHRWEGTMAPGKRSEASDQTRENIKQAFLELYAAKPIERISIREITDRAGYNRATFYLYFRDIYDVLATVEDELLAGVDAIVTPLLSREDIYERMGSFLSLASRFTGPFSVLLGDNGDPTFTRRFSQRLEPLLGRLLVTRRELDAHERELVSAFYLAGVVAVVVAWLQDPRDMGVDELVRFIVDDVLQAHV